MTNGDALGLLESAAADPLFWPPSRPGVESAWYGHVPFAHWLVAATLPRLVVELGTHNGVSFAAFCEAVRRRRIAARCIAVDLWQGDAHAGFYADSVYRNLAAFVHATYPAFAELRRMTFDQALPHVADGSVDLLHVDGRHRYSDVRADYEGWRPKLSARAIVLFHDVCETRDDFGVHRYWAELATGAPHFVFPHAHGLGVLLAGADPPAAAEALCALRTTPAAGRLRARFADLGGRWVTELRAQEAERAVACLRAHQAALQAFIDQRAQVISAPDDRFPEPTRPPQARAAAATVPAAAP